MKIVIINGQNHKGNTYMAARQLAEKIGGDIQEFFLPRDFSGYCLGCFSCFKNGAETCKDYQDIKPITDAMDSADVLIFESPVYAMHASGQMKSFLDHLAYRFMVHRPEESMFSKQAVVISTAAGAGMKSTNKDMADSLFYWGVPKIYKIGIGVQATTPDELKDEFKSKIDKKTSEVADKIKRNNGKVKPGFKTKGFFYIMRMVQKKGWLEKDREYWHEKGWVYDKRPWRK